MLQHRADFERTSTRPWSLCMAFACLEILHSEFGSERTQIFVTRLTPLRPLASWEAMWTISTVLATWLTKQTLGELWRDNPIKHTGISLKVFEKGSESWVELCQDFFHRGNSWSMCPSWTPSRRSRQRAQLQRDVSLPSCSGCLAIPKLKYRFMSELTFCWPSSPWSKQFKSLRRFRTWLRRLEAIRSPWSFGTCQRFNTGKILGRSDPQQQTSRRIYCGLMIFVAGLQHLGRKCWSST